MTAIVANSARLLVFALTLKGGATESLEKVRAQAAIGLRRLPNYTCVQTIERVQRRAPSRKFQLIDMVRLEVALVNGKELFSWPGAGQFEDKEIGDLVKGGAIGNGNFALHARSVFLSDSPVFTARGQEDFKGRPALRWDYRVPVGRSGYSLRMGSKEALVPYRGSFWVDAASLDLIRLEVIAEEIPVHLQLASARDAVEYARVPIAGESFLLPESSDLSLIDIGGSESRNRTRFSRCRQYAGESVLIFGDPAAETSTAPVAEVSDLPPGVDLEVNLETPVVPGESAVGDPLTAILVRDTKRPKLLKGSQLRGRITHLRQSADGRHWVIGLMFFELKSGSTLFRFESEIENIAGLNLAIPRAGRPGSLVFAKGYTPKLGRGTRMVWRTVARLPEDRQ